MTDWSTMAHRFENSPENVAFKLMHEIAKAERKGASRHPRLGAIAPDRQWILDTYCECLEAVRGQRTFTRSEANKKNATLTVV